MTLPDIYLGPVGPAFPREPVRWASPATSADGVRWAWPDAGKVRVRKLLSRAARRPIFRFSSLKMGRSIHLESQLEHELALLLDACPRVDAFAEQPVVMEFNTAGGTARHIPDFAVAHQGRPWFVEVKFARDVDAAVLERTHHLTKLLADVGVGYRLMTEQDLPAPTRLSNAWSLLQRGRRMTTDHDTVLTLHQVITHPRITLGELGWDDTTRATILARELMQGRLHTDFSARLSSTSIVQATPVEGGWLWA